MHYRITHAMVGIVAGALIVVVALFGLVVLAANGGVEAASARPPVIPPIPHPVNGQKADCATCHKVGPAALPQSHATYGANTCLTCHAVASETALGQSAQNAVPEQEQSSAQGPAAIPHPAGDAYANCVGCHAIGSTRGMPDNHASYTNEMCVNCHAAVASEESTEGAAPGAAGTAPLVPHDIAGQFVNCDSCHAPEMGQLAMPENHQGFTKETCTNCHKPAN